MSTSTRYVDDCGNKTDVPQPMGGDAERGGGMVTFTKLPQIFSKENPTLTAIRAEARKGIVYGHFC